MESTARAPLQHPLQSASNATPSAHQPGPEQPVLPAQVFQRRRQYLADHIDDVCDCVDQESFEI